MRITDQMMYQNLTQNLDQAQAAYVRTQEEASSGVSISQPSDNPAGTAVVLQLTSAQQQVTSWQGNARAAQSKMQTADQAMSQIQSVISSAQSLAEQGTSGSMTAQDLTDLSQKAASLVQQAESLANTQYAGEYVFSGVAQQAPVVSGAYNPAATSAPQTIEIGQGVKVQTSVDGNQAFNTAPVSTPSDWSTNHSSQATLLNVLSALQSDLSSGNTAAVEADLGALAAQGDNVSSLRAQLGANMEQVQAAVSQLTTMSSTLQIEQGNVENVDMAQVLTQLTAQQTAYQAAVAAGANMKLPTLASYLS